MIQKGRVIFYVSKLRLVTNLEFVVDVFRKPLGVIVLHAILSNGNVFLGADESPK